MDRETVIATLKQLEPRLRAHGVAALYLYGSYARDEARPDRDVDLLVEPVNEAEFNLFTAMDAADVVEEALPSPGIEVSIGTRDNIVPLYLPYIEAAAVRVF